MPHDHPVTQLINTTYNLKQLWEQVRCEVLKGEIRRSTCIYPSSDAQRPFDFVISKNAWERINTGYSTCSSQLSSTVHRREGSSNESAMKWVTSAVSALSPSKMLDKHANGEEVVMTESRWFVPANDLSPFEKFKEAWDPLDNEAPLLPQPTSHSDSTLFAAAQLILHESLAMQISLLKHTAACSKCGMAWQ